MVSTPEPVACGRISRVVRGWASAGAASTQPAAAIKARRVSVVIVVSSKGQATMARVR